MNKAPSCAPSPLKISTLHFLEVSQQVPIINSIPHKAEEQNIEPPAPFANRILFSRCWILLSWILPTEFCFSRCSEPQLWQPSKLPGACSFLQNMKYFQLPFFPHLKIKNSWRSSHALQPKFTYDSICRKKKRIYPNCSLVQSKRRDEFAQVPREKQGGGWAGEPWHCQDGWEYLSIFI